MTPPSLDTMPKLVIERLIEISDWKSVLTLRQVCQRLRNLVDTAPEAILPDAKFLGIRVAVKSDRIEMEFTSQAKVYFDSYHINENGKIKRYIGGEFIEFDAEHLVEMATNNLELCLRFQKSILTGFLKIDVKDTEAGITHNGQILQVFPAILENVLKSRIHSIKAYKFQLITYDPNHIMHFLPLLDPECLEHIEFGYKNSPEVEFD